MGLGWKSLAASGGAGAIVRVQSYLRPVMNIRREFRRTQGRVKERCQRETRTGTRSQGSCHSYPSRDPIASCRPLGATQPLILQIQWTRIHLTRIQLAAPFFRVYIQHRSRPIILVLIRQPRDRIQMHRRFSERASYHRQLGGTQKSI